jgi:hypothetical protein
MNRMPRITVLVLACLLAGCASVPSGPEIRAKKLIEFGWDEPGTSFMRQHVHEMEAMPFDGCVFHIEYKKGDGSAGQFIWELWGTRRFAYAELMPAIGDLQATHFERFTDNFLRVNVVPGDVDWFDDYAAILDNVRLAATAAREGNVAGILLDAEQYHSPLFTYRQQRDAGTKSWEAYARQARLRGREVMNALQDGYPRLTILLTFGYAVPWLESRKGAAPLTDIEYGLLVPFLDGMVDAARPGTRLVDGYEPTYYHNRDVTKFASAYRIVKQDVLPIVADPKRYQRVMSVGFGLWLDFDSTAIGWNEADGSKNFYTPEDFERSVRAALAASDRYVWIYTQVPQWWSDSGSPLKLPSGYAEALRRVRELTAR